MSWSEIENIIDYFKDLLRITYFNKYTRNLGYSKKEIDRKIFELKEIKRIYQIGLKFEENHHKKNTTFRNRTIHHIKELIKRNKQKMLQEELESIKKKGKSGWISRSTFWRLKKDLKKIGIVLK